MFWRQHILLLSPTQVVLIPVYDKLTYNKNSSAHHQLLNIYKLINNKNKSAHNQLLNIFIFFIERYKTINEKEKNIVKIMFAFYTLTEFMKNAGGRG